MAIADSVTAWLRLWRAGDDQALEEVTALVYQDLRRVAGYYLAGESNANTLQATALVHEAYLNVAGVRDFDWKERAQFIAVVAQMMRRILVDHARSRNALKRDGSLADVPSPGDSQPSTLDLLAVDQALNRMAGRYPRCCQIVELRFFGDLEFTEIAELLDVSLTTVERDWRFARAWLQSRIEGA
jgi:RNA polymerase sigma factor (TIGR02999 family)